MMKGFKISYRILFIQFIIIFLLFFFCSDSNKNPSITKVDDITPAKNDPVDTNTDTDEDIVYDSKSITEFVREIVRTLSGAAEIVPGINVSNRYTEESKILVRQFLIDVFNEIEISGQRHEYSYDDSTTTRNYHLEGENIYAVLEATEESDEYIILGAHYDTVKDSPGADDNASGVALVMAAARSLAGIANRTKNFIFVLFDHEEFGGIGSKCFAQEVLNNNTDIHSMHNFDMVGWDRDGDRVVELGAAYSGAFELYTEASDSTKLNIPLQEVWITGSDHTSFRDLGFNSLLVTEEDMGGDTTPYIHTPNDTYNTINFNYLYSSTLLAIEAMKLLLKQ